jgi:hypothetical protein
MALLSFVTNSTDAMSFVHGCGEARKQHFSRFSAATLAVENCVQKKVGENRSVRYTAKVVGAPEGWCSGSRLDIVVWQGTNNSLDGLVIACRRKCSERVLHILP